MYAVVETGGKQYKVESGQYVRVGKIEGDVGTKLTLDKVVLTGGDKTTVGSPYVDGASVEAEIVRQGRTRKVMVFKYKPKKRYRIKKGHRQHFTVLKIGSIK